jgi:phosphatidate cytidylyltransferase
MLKTRVITALIILPIVLVALFMFPNWAWDFFTMGIALVSCWEWSRFCQFPLGGKRIYLALSCVLAAVVFFSYLDNRFVDLLFDFKQLAFVSFIISTLFWFIAVPLWLANLWRPGSRAIAAIAGWIVIFPTWLAFLILHDLSPWLFLSFAFIVWVADVFAYFVGKAIGKQKLAPSISPGKTIQGAFGGMAGVALYFFVWKMLAEQSVARGETWANQLLSHGLWVLGFFVLLGVLSVIGDLFESWMKRGANMKDSSGLLPGHGGFLDRIDALTSTLPVACLYILFTAQK